MLHIFLPVLDLLREAGQFTRLRVFTRCRRFLGTSRFLRCVSNKGSVKNKGQSCFSALFRREMPCVRFVGESRVREPDKEHLRDAGDF